MRRVPGVLGTVLVLMSIAVSAQQRWYELYDDGLGAFKRGDWAIAEQRFKAALAAKPAQEQGQRVLFYGTRREPYLPEYYLAQIYLKLGRTREAGDLAAKLERDGRITTRDPQFRALRDLAVAIREPAQVLAGSTAPSAGRGADAIGSPAGAGSPNPLNTTGVGSTASPPPNAATTGSAPAATGAGTPTPTGADPNVSSPAPPIPPTTPPAGLAASRAATVERNALLAFYQGNYQRALALLDSDALKQNPTPRRMFYMACSNAALGLLEGEKGTGRISAARSQFAQAGGLAARFAEDRRYISPKVLAALSGRREQPQ